MDGSWSAARRLELVPQDALLASTQERKAAARKRLQDVVHADFSWPQVSMGESSAVKNRNEEKMGPLNMSPGAPSCSGMPRVKIAATETKTIVILCCLAFDARRY